MDMKIKAIYQKIKDLEEDLEKEVNLAAEKLQYHFRENKVFFEQSIIEYHRKLKKTFLRYMIEANPYVVLTAPVIYAMIVPLVLTDICVTLYQAICFPIYGIKKVPRSDFIVVDRHHLEYLNFYEKINCVYCGYGTGLAGYLREIVARTEKYWCPIKHAHRVKHPHSVYQDFEEYGDAEGYRKLMKKLKKE